jgi:hemolysin activation/secretion protein
MSLKLHRWLAAACIAATSSGIWAQGPTFSIQRFEVSGNTLLPDSRVAHLMAPFSGEDRSFTDVQLALESLERAYRDMGYSAVAVTLPEQDISGGVVQFVVIESKIGLVRIEGNNAFSNENILRSLPALVAGSMPNAITLAENVALANGNPARQVELTLRLSDQPGEVDALVKVEESPITRWVVNLDNSGRGGIGGDWRLGLAWQHANLFDRDHLLTLQATTSPDQFKEVWQFSTGYRIPIYGSGDSLEWFAGISNADAGSLITGIDSFVGKGRTAGLRYTRNLTRLGEYDHELKVGLDWKAFENACAGVSCGLLDSTVTTTPLILSYHGNWARPGAQTQWELGYARNLGWGGHNRPGNYASAAHQPGTVGTERRYQLWRLTASHLQILPGNYQFRANWTAQYTGDPLIAGEQLGLTGSNQVRGYNERAVARDRGQVLTLELYSPDLSHLLPIKFDNVRLLVFADAAHGRYVTTSTSPSSVSESVTSHGLGLRISHQNRYALKLDVAEARNAVGAQKRGKWTVHALISLSF